MAYLGTFHIDDYVGIPAATHRFSSGAAYAPTALTYSIYEEATDVGLDEDVDMVVASPFDSITGCYWVRRQLTAAAGFEAGKNYLVVVKATVDSVAAIQMHTFQVEAASVAQTGDAYAVVAHADYGNSKLVRSTTPANTLTVDASHQAFADVSAISGDSTAADHLEAILDAMPGGAVVDDNDPDPTATAFETNLSEATNDHYNGAFVVFTSGALLGQSRKISDYDGTSKVLTVAAAFTEAPTVGDTFLILGRSE